MRLFRRGCNGGVSAVWLLTLWVAVLLLPCAVLAFTEPWPVLSKAGGVLIAGGVCLLLTAAPRRTAAAVLVMTPLAVLCAVQIVLLFLYGGSVIASDMFINMMTTNRGEAGEVLHNLWPAIIFVCLVYLPLPVWAVWQLHRGCIIPRNVRRQVLRAGAVIAAAGLTLLAFEGRRRGGAAVADEVFPVNAVCNIGYAAMWGSRVRGYESSSERFSFHALPRERRGEGREIYVYVIGEASRAANWQLYGYDRKTNPRLAERQGLTLFRNVTTQSNATHKSVPMLLSPVSTLQQYNLYYLKGLPSLFGESGFRTCFLSNQSPQGAMVDKLAGQADEVVYIGAPRRDDRLLALMRGIVETDDLHDLFIVLHCYGSHYSYNQRYPQEFALFGPDDDMTIDIRNADRLRNAYDNTILYTDRFLDEVLEYLSSQPCASALLYCSDHGEDLFDDARGRFLHASPSVSYYQLHVPSFAWFSDEYARRYPERCRAAAAHASSPVSTHAMFHTMADMAGIRSPFVEAGVSLVNGAFRENAERYYLDDRNRAVRVCRRSGFADEDCREFRRRGIVLPE